VDQAGGALPIEEADDALRSLLDRIAEWPTRVRAALARLVRRWPHADARSRLEGFLGDPAADVQLEALRGLNATGAKGLSENVLAGLLTSAVPAVRAEVVRAAVREGFLGLLEGAAADPDATVRAALAEGLSAGAGAGDTLLSALQGDAHPHVRAAALTPGRAAELIEHPERETSWHVLARAARLQKVPFWTLEPDSPWHPEPVLPPIRSLLEPSWPPPPRAATLGPEQFVVSRVGISGHYGLPVEGFVRAAEAGVNLMFWEPNYHTMTEFVTRLAPGQRRALHLISGTFEADGKRVRRDAERVLRALRVERVSVFLLFWVQSWARVRDDVCAALERLKEEGLVATFGLSTHSRPLALEALEAGWNPVMVRHSAAHRGAEQEVLPRALARGASVLTFNNTCYARLLKPHGAVPPPSAADCYRYTLAQPGVTATLSAPATVEYLEENLTALRDPALPEERLRSLLDQGDAVYREDTVFRKLVRGR
jgi:hypothetical protein